jgi:hypothetical protein
MVSLKTQLQLPIYYHGKSKKNNYIFIIMVSLKRQLQLHIYYYGKSKNTITITYLLLL